MATIRVELEPRASGITAVIHSDHGELAKGRGGVVCQAARRLLLLGHSGKDRLEAWRGDTMCLAGWIDAFAELKIGEQGSGPRFAKFQPFDRSAIEDE